MLSELSLHSQLLYKTNHIMEHEAKDKPNMNITINEVHKRALLFFFDKLTVIYPVISILKIVIKKKRTTMKIIMLKIAIVL